MSSETKYKLTYYNFRGLAEPIRLIFVYAGVPFDDERIKPDLEHYPRLPANIKSRLPYAKLPVLEIMATGKVLSQSMAIARYLASEFGLCGASNFESAQCDELVAAVQDFHRAGYALANEKNEETKAALQKEMAEVTFPLYMTKWEKMVTGNGGKFLIGSKLTWADLVLFYFLETVVENGPTALDQLPGLRAFSTGIGSLPAIKKWIETRPKDETPAVKLQQQ